MPFTQSKVQKRDCNKPNKALLGSVSRVFPNNYSMLTKPSFSAPKNRIKRKLGCDQLPIKGSSESPI